MQSVLAPSIFVTFSAINKYDFIPYIEQLDSVNQLFVASTTLYPAICFLHYYIYGVEGDGIEIR